MKSGSQQPEWKSHFRTVLTEVAPATIKKLTPSEIADHSRFTVFYRVGSGYQNIQGKDDNAKESIEGSSTSITGAYAYMTGGVNPSNVVSPYGDYKIQFYMPGNVNNYGALTSFPRGGTAVRRHLHGTHGIMSGFLLPFISQRV